MSTIADRYRRRADAFERKVAAVAPDQWANQSPCAEWTARDVVGHVVDMHIAMLRPLERQPRQAPPVDEDPLAAFVNARAEIEAVLDELDPTISLPADAIGLPRGHQHGPRAVTVPEGFWADRDSPAPLGAGADAYTSGG